jgi:DNA topoisomerase I
LVARRTRKGRVFFGCSRYPDCDYSTWKLPGKDGKNADGDETEPDNVQADKVSD